MRVNERRGESKRGRATACERERARERERENERERERERERKRERITLTSQRRGDVERRRIYEEEGSKKKPSLSCSLFSSSVAARGASYGRSGGAGALGLSFFFPLPFTSLPSPFPTTVFATILISPPPCSCFLDLLFKHGCNRNQLGAISAEEKPR